MNYSSEILNALRWTGGEDYLDRFEIWEVHQRIYPGVNCGTVMFTTQCIR